MLVMSKKAAGSFNYDDGVYMKFKNSQPQHLQFYCRASTLEAESCDIRLYKASSKAAISKKSSDDSSEATDSADTEVADNVEDSSASDDVPPSTSTRTADDPVFSDDLEAGNND